MAHVDSRLLDEVAALLRPARRVLFVTGAGISAESGLPTYRGVGGLYADQHTPEGLPIEEVLSGAYFRLHPEISWRYIQQIEAATRGARFNPAHAAIASLEGAGREVVVLTQNVDGLHRAAGSTQVIDLHGDLHDLLCTGCSWGARAETFEAAGGLPRCPVCGAVIRPDVVLFGELLPEGKVRRLQEEVARGFELVFSVGTSSLFPYVAWPVLAAAREGRATVEINPEETALSEVVDVRLRLGAVAAMEGILARL